MHARDLALRYCFALAAGWLIGLGTTWGQGNTEKPTQAQVVQALTKANSAVVGLEVTAIEDARSAQTLGRTRIGSGVLIGPDDLILTIGYLIVEADTIEVTTQDRRTWPARAVAYDLATGFGLVRPLAPLRGIAPVALGSHKDLSSGESLMVATGGSEGEVALTQVVSTRAFSGYWEYHIEAALFTSPPVGNHSGAPLFNQRGELLGIGSLFVADALGYPPRVPGNMFVPVDLLKPILAEMQRTGQTAQSRRPWLGVTSTEQAGHVHVMRVTSGSPAEAGGIEPGDIVLAVDDQPVNTLEAFYKRVWERPSPEDAIRITLQRGGDVTTLSIKGVDRMSTMTKPRGI